MLGVVLLVWASLVVILAAAPEVYDQALRLPPGDRRAAERAFLAALWAFIAGLDLPGRDRAYLLELTPATYTGLAAALVAHIHAQAAP